MSVSDTLLTGLEDRIDSLELSVGGQLCTVVRRKYPKAQEGLDPLPMITVTPAPRAGKNVFWSTEQRKRIEYLYEVTIFSAGNQDAISNQGDHLLAQQRIAGCIEPPSVFGVAELYEFQVEGDPQYDRSASKANYDQSRVTLRAVTIQPSRNT